MSVRMINAVRADDILRQVRERDIRSVRFLFCDIGSIVRAKATHVRDLEDRLHAGIGVTRAIPAMTILDQVASVEGLSGAGDVRLIPDTRTFVELPYAARTASMCANLVTLDGTAWPYCPRTFLARMVNLLGSKGLRAQAAFEGEFTLFLADGERLVPADTTAWLSTMAMSSAAPVINAIFDALEAQHLYVEEHYAGAGAGQHKITIRHADGVAAADNHVIFRETVHGVASEHGLIASFAPKPAVTQLGNACHLHFSLTDSEGRSKLFFAPDAPLKLSRTGHQFVAGVLDHLPALMALTCGSVNSYRRLLSEQADSPYACWGPDNRDAAVRLVSPVNGDEAESINGELRLADHSANPYLALGALIAAGLDGMSREIEPAEPVLTNPVLLSDAERTRQHIRRLPPSLGDALDALAADVVLSQALGAELLSVVQGVKRLETRLFADQDADFELNAYNSRL